MPFVKGQSGNPGGRVKRELTVTGAIRQALSQKDDTTGRANRIVIAQRLLAMAKAGDIDAIKVVLDRSDGKVAEKIEGESIIRIHLAWDDNADG